ncbi:MAG TPA: hypothetical protein VHO23_02545, partial [Candidatus Paceibacterota bacterium]|nr:hypothetical protein [Candidatus Paceibacterota bacterium]
MEIEEAANTYSFINVLRNDTRFSEFGSNALPLFALYHYLAIEDIAVFASDSLTDQPDDKKADFIYINEAEGIACIAQGYTAKDWGRKEAPANKASDLNTAAAWLLQASIGKIPETIRSHAKLLRDGLEQKTINKIVFVYAHNALESENVRRELKTVQDLVQGLALTKDAEIETLEIGLRQLEELHLTSQGQIQIT